MSGFEMETLKALPPCHPQLVEAIITQIKSQGLFDDFRKSCLSDIDTKPSYLNLKQRVEGYVNNFLSRQQWSSTLQKNQLRETLRKDINESGLLKTGLDHLVDQLLYAHAEKSIRPKVRAEISKFLNLSDEPNHTSSGAVCAPKYTAATPNYGPPAMPPLPPVPPPPDVTGAMIDSFGGPKPPEPPSPHGSEYSVDMSDSSMVGRDEAPPAIPSRTTNTTTVTSQKPNFEDSEVLSGSPMDIEEDDDEEALSSKKGTENQALVHCSSPEIFEEVSEGGSLGGTPVRDEEASFEKKPNEDQTRTDFTGLFKDRKTSAEQSADSEVIMDEESMVFEVLEECVKTEETVKSDVAAAANDSVEVELTISSQGADLGQHANETPILDEDPDEMQISADDETQCVDEVQSPRNEAEDKTPEMVIEATDSGLQPAELFSIVEGNSRESTDADLSDTQPPLQIDTEDTQPTMSDKNQLDESQEGYKDENVGNIVDTCEPQGDPSKSADCDNDASTGELNQSDSKELQPKTSESDKVDSEKLDSINGSSEDNTAIASSNTNTTALAEAVESTETSNQGRSSSNHSKVSKHRETKPNVHQKTSSRGESDRDRQREHKSSSSSSHHRSSSSSRSKKFREHEQRSRDKDHSDQRDNHGDRSRERKKERDSKDRSRDRAQRDSKHSSSSSSSHSRRRHSRHHQDRRRDDERKSQCSAPSSSNKSNRSKNNTNSSNLDQVLKPGLVAENVGKEIGADNKTSPQRENKDVVDNSVSSEKISARSTVEETEPTQITPNEAVAATSNHYPETSQGSPGNSKIGKGNEGNDLDSEVLLRKRKRKASSKHHDSLVDQDRAPPDAKDARKENSAGRGRRRSSAASVSSQQSAEVLEQPESPVPSKFGRQRKINPKYEDDGTLSALLFGKN